MKLAASESDNTAAFFARVQYQHLHISKFKVFLLLPSTALGNVD